MSGWTIWLAAATGLGGFASAPDAQEQPSVQQAYDNAAVLWETCERPLQLEMATRRGRAGPAGSPSADALGNCDREAEALARAIAALPTTEARDAAEAAWRKARESIDAEARAAFQANNYE